ncbi:MAG: CBS domain-containing protein [Myxococcales bacterium]|nr:MAG: CBS domain-containing protein [Myxococcales bacterium]
MYEFLDYRVEDVMSRAVTVRAEMTLAEAEALLEKQGFNSLPVVDAGERLVGIVTSLDLLRAFAFPEDTILPSFSDVMQRPVSSVMSRDAQSVCPRTPLTRVLQKIVDTRNKSFPVVDDDRVVGIIAREDLMLALRRAEEGRVLS